MDIPRRISLSIDWILRPLRFEFEVAFESRSLNAREVDRIPDRNSGFGKNEFARVVFFGVWKLNKDFSVSSELPYAEWKANGVNQEAFSLSRNIIYCRAANMKGRPVGMALPLAIFSW